MEELKNLVGRTVKVYAYIGKKNERLRYVRGAIKSASATGIVLESLSEHTVITIQANKIMTIREWEPDTWKRVTQNNYPKILWGNAHTFKRREEEIEKHNPLYYFINGIALTLMLVAVVWLGWSISLLTHGFESNIALLSLNTTTLIKSGGGVANATYITHALNLNSSFNISGFNTNTNVLSAKGWHTLTIYWSFLCDTLTYVLLMLGILFTWIFFRPRRFFNEDFYIEIRAYMYQKLDDEMK